MNFNIIGAGRLGKNIALALSTADIAKLLSICNQSLASASQSCSLLHAGDPVNSIAALPAADVIWITSNDDSIQSIVDQLLQNTQLKLGCFVIHCSGVLDSSILSALKTRGCFVASFHPLKAFATGYLDAKAFNKVYCVIEGDAQPCTWLQAAFTSLGAEMVTINPQAKACYHAAACMALNYFVTLTACTEELLRASGIAADEAQNMVLNLMKDNVAHLEQAQSTAKALTGPIMRGDIQTLGLHLQAIDNPEVLEFYKAAGLATLPLTELSAEKKQAIEQLFHGKH